MKRYYIVAVLGLACLVGCGSEEDSYKLVKVSGTVTKNGKPLADATVSFVPDITNAHSTPAVDRTSREGSYLVMFKGRTGIAPGKYKVIITPALELPAGGTIPAGFEKQPGMLQAGLAAKNKASKSKSALAEAKKEAARSEFDAQIEASVASQVCDFDVKS